MISSIKITDSRSKGLKFLFTPQTISHPTHVIYSAVLALSETKCQTGYTCTVMDRNQEKK